MCLRARAAVYVRCAVCGLRVDALRVHPRVVPEYTRVCVCVLAGSLPSFMRAGRAAWRCVLWEDCDYLKWRNLALDRTAVRTKFYKLR